MSQPETRITLQPGATVSAAFPLALLEAVRAHDRPGEILEDEDVMVSLPRRLGLTGVVETQIFRYEAAQKAGRDVPLDEALGLIRLVMRRPDLESILRDTGKRIARRQFRNAPVLWTRVLHRGPAKLGLRSARRAVVRALGDLHLGDPIQAAKPFSIRVTNCATARIDDDGVGCALITGLVEEQLLLSTGKPQRVHHNCCIARADDVCEWTLRTE